MADENLKKLFLLDGMALAYRAHFALAVKPITTSRGFNTSAIYGFTSTLIDLLKTQNPTHIAVVFDTDAPTQRHADFADYKAQRQAMPEELKQAFPYVRKMIEAFRIPILAIDGYEADDVIGTLARRAQQEGFVTYMVTPDKDFGQLVSEQIFMYKPSRMGNGIEILGVNEILQKWGVSRVEQVVDILGLWGDSSDNIPGVPGVGEKTAQKLISEYGSIESLLERRAELKGKLKDTFETHHQNATLSKKLATILVDVPLDIELASFERKDLDRDAIAALCAELEFHTLGRRLLGDTFSPGRAASFSTKKTEVPPLKKSSSQGLANGEFDFGDATSVEVELPPKGETEISAKSVSNCKTIKEVPHEYFTLTTSEERAGLINQLKNATSFCLDLETSSLDYKTCSIVGLSFSFEAHKAFYVPFPKEIAEVQSILEEFKDVLEDPKIEKVGHHLKFDLSVLQWHGVQVQGKLFDTMLAHAIFEPEQRHGMNYLAEVYLGYAPIPIEQLIGHDKKQQISMRDVPIAQLAEYAAEDADITWQLRQIFEPLLKEKGLERVFNEIECPLIPVLVDMEIEGVAISPQVLAEFSVQLEEQITTLESQIFAEAGTSFNLNSPKQLGEILFLKLQLVPGAKKTRTGQFATDEQTLVALSSQHLIVKKILDFREATKLKSTYVDSLPTAILPKTGRIHTTFNQMITTTGRLNSQDPNLQNIPIRTEQGREIRKAFVAGKSGFSLLTADYSQIELRIIAALSGDPGMLEAFDHGIDIHQATAAKVYGVTLDNVTFEMRRKAKMVNFGIIYGISAFGLAQRLGISRGEAGEIISAYFRQYPLIKEYMNNTIAFAREHGYVQTVTGRRRYIRDITSANVTARGSAERNAINAPIQGTAADLIKIAMVRIHRVLREKQLKTRMILQVHDELVFEMANEEKEEVTLLVEKEMKEALPELKVPIVVEIGTGDNWLIAHS